MAEPTSTAEKPIDLPTGEPIPSAPDDAAAASEGKKTAASSNNKKPNNLAPALKAALLSLPASTDAFLAHLQRCLATPSGIDTLLLFICYTSRLSSAVLSSLSQVLLRRSARELVALAFTLPPKTAIIFTSSAAASASASASSGVGGAPSAAVAKNAAAQLAALLAARLKNLGSLASEARTIARLWALVGMYFWAKRLTLQLLSSSQASSSATEKEKQREGKPTSITTKRLVALMDWTQFLSCAAFQVLENGAYLSSRGVLGWTPQQQGRAYMVGSRWLAVYTGLEIGKLLAKMMAPHPRATTGLEGSEDAKAEAEEERAQMEAVRRSMAINLAWTPLTVHWSTEKGLLSDGWVGLGGCIPGIIQIRKLWRETAQ